MDGSPGYQIDETGRPPGVRFFTIADDQHYLGLVAMVNSLRLQRHRDPVTVLDLGLTAAQRAELADECDLVDPGSDLPRNPWLLAPHLCRLRDAEVVVYIDCDVIVAASLDPVLDQAQRGSICAFPDIEDRFFPEWEETFDLRAPLRRQRYVNTGLVAFSTDQHPSLLRRWEECCDRIRDCAGAADGQGHATPTGLPDQDALNALLMSEFAADDLALQPASGISHGPHALHRTHIVDRQTLRCRRDGEPITLLHSWGNPKPWQVAAGRNLQRTAYLVCLRRLLNARDVVVRSTEARVGWLAPGVLGTLAWWARLAYGATRRTAWRIVRKVAPASAVTGPGS